MELVSGNASLYELPMYIAYLYQKNLNRSIITCKLQLPYLHVGSGPQLILDVPSGLRTL
jgi:hypothetical protein